MGAGVPRSVLCLGNPGPEYSGTRHNVAWWLADRLADVYDLGRFRQEGAAAVARGRIDGVAVQLVKPLTYMNRSGRVAESIARREGFALDCDLLVVVDDTALEPGRIRLRPAGSAGGHNGLKSVESSLGTTEYPRLRIGVGGPPPGAVRTDWVLSAPSRSDREAILARFGDLVECVGLWVTDGLEAAMNRCNA